MILGETTTRPDIARLTLLRSVIARRLSPAHAALFAEPRGAQGVTQWHAEGTRCLPETALSEASRAALRHHAGSILSDIRRVAESEAGVIRSEWQRLPGGGPGLALFLVDRRPVIVGWGETLARPPWVGEHDDGCAPTPRHGMLPRPPALWPVARSAALAGLAVGVALLAWLPVSRACRNIQNADAWARHDTNAMAGCWERTNNMSGASNDVLTRQDYLAWRLCVGPDGQNGTLTVELADAAGHSESRCNSRATAHFHGDLLETKTEPCRMDRTTYLPRSAVCRAEDADHVTCRIHVDVPDSTLPAGYRQGHEDQLTRVRADTPAGGQIAGPAPGSVPVPGAAAPAAAAKPSGPTTDTSR